MSETERATESGILLPEPSADKGHPLGIAQTNVAGLQINFVGKTAEHVHHMANLIADAQRAVARGDETVLLELTEPFFGQKVFLTPRGIESIVSVMRGFAPAIDPFAERQAAAPRLVAVRGGRGGR